MLEITGGENDEKLSIHEQIAQRVGIQRALTIAKKVYPVMVFNAEGIGKDELVELMKADIEYFSNYFKRMGNNV